MTCRLNTLFWRTGDRGKAEMASKRKRLGKLKPLYTFFLNPYERERFTRCPQCRGITRIRKFPFAIHVDPAQMVQLNMSGPFCPVCELIILHQNVVEDLLTRLFSSFNPDMIGNNYFIIGTVERAHWKKSSKQGGTVQEAFDNLHDFKKHVSFEVQRGWFPIDSE